MSERAVLYSRVSDPGSQEEGRQVEDLRRLATESGWTVVAEVRERMSGTKRERPGLSRVLELAGARAVDVVAVSELSRLTRRGIGDLFDLVRALTSEGVRVHSLSEPWANGDGALRDLLLSVAGTFARMEREALVQRTKSGMEHAKAQGKRVGRPPKLTSDLLRRIVELREAPGPDGSRRTWNQIAQSVHSPAGSCKKWYSASRRPGPTVINGPQGIGSTRDDP
ncbi:MAG TPA: recombinase family protein [Thermoplasmata archaeon]|nr:recombinase family protein [Thermoplasmata archaeon]